MTIQSHLNTQKTINLGSFYTPESIVNIAYEMLLKAIDNPKEYVLLDSSCGYGSFLQSQAFKQNIGVDIDREALKIAKEHRKNSHDLINSQVDFQMNSHSKAKPQRHLQVPLHTLLLHANSLYQTSREKFHIHKSSKLIIIGNPPYNDTTSIVRNRLKTQKSYPIDSHLKARDIGISFLRSFDVLKADVICVLHPLSYLIKETNFRALRDFAKNYCLANSMIISSKLFCPKSLGYFPIVIALYKRDVKGMNYDYICNFSFQTIEGKSFRLKDFDFISKYIDKYPNKNRIDSTQKVAMFYTLRDINALRRSKTFINKDCANAVYVTWQTYSLYCYVDVFKQFIPHIPYYFGNCDILIDFKKFKTLESSFIKASESKILSEDIVVYFKALLGEHYED